MNKFFRKLKKHWITVWLVVAIIAVGTFITFASYTGIYSVKRVVSTTASAGVLFSSNSMQSYTGNDIPSRHITTSQASGNYSYNLTVCDFAQSDPLTRYKSDSGIPYNLTAQLYVKVNGNYYPVNDTTNVSPEIRTHAASRTFSIQYSSDGGTSVASDNNPISLSGGNEVSFSSQNIRPQVSGNAIPNGTNKYTIKVNGRSYTDKNGKPVYWSAKNGVVDLTGIQIDPKTTIKRVMVVTGERQAYLEGRNETTNIIRA